MALSTSTTARSASVLSLRAKRCVIQSSCFVPIILRSKPQVPVRKCAYATECTYLSTATHRLRPGSARSGSRNVHAARWRPGCPLSPVQPPRHSRVSRGPGSVRTVSGHHRIEFWPGGLRNRDITLGNTTCAIAPRPHPPKKFTAGPTPAPRVDTAAYPQAGQRGHAGHANIHTGATPLFLLRSRPARPRAPSTATR